MKKKILYVLFAVLVPSIMFAADLRSGETLIAPKIDTVSENAYYLGKTIDAQSDFSKDLFVLAQESVLSGQFRGDIAAVSGKVTLSSPVLGDARLVGSEVDVKSDISGDLIVVGAKVTISSNIHVGGDLIVIADKATIEGKIDGRVRVYGNDIVLNAEVAKNVEMTVTTLTVNGKTTIGGNLVYGAPKEAVIDSGAVIAGQKEFTKLDTVSKNRSMFWAVFGGISRVLEALAMLLTLLIFYWIARPFMISVVLEATNFPLRNFLLGFAGVILTPLAVLFLLTTIIGIVPALLLLFLYFLVMTLSFIFGSAIIGYLFVKNALKDTAFNWKSIVIGVVLLGVIKALPFLGWAVGSIVFFVAFGAMVKKLLQNVRGF